jgi:hypothetical protein
VTLIAPGSTARAVIVVVDHAPAATLPIEQCTAESLLQ